jgi:uncharacterized membrane protein
LGGDVFQDQRPLSEGVEFQVGGTKIAFEAAGAAGAAPAGAAAGAAGGPDMAAAGAAAGAAGAAAKNAAADALKSLPSGPVKIDGSATGIPLGDVVKGAFGIVKANLVPSVLLFLIPALATVLNITIQILAGMGLHGPLKIVGLIAMIFGVLNLLWALASPLTITNYIAGVKKYQETGESFGIGQLFSFDNFLHKYLTALVAGLGFMCCCIPGVLLMFSSSLIVDKPELGIAGALKGSLAFVKRNFVPVFMLLIVMVVLNIIGNILCGLGAAITQPACMAAVYLAYECKRGEFEAAMAEDGVSAAA